MPTPAMRKSMSEAELGDEQTMSDPTVTRLENMAAELLGKEAALFVASGIMGNLVSTLVHCSTRGSQMIVGSLSHSYRMEQGNVAQLASVHQLAITNKPDGTFDLKELEDMIVTGAQREDPHFARQALISIENTHNRCGGVALPQEWVDQVAIIAHKHGLKVHMDGARLFNAACKLGLTPARIARDVDSVSICLSKGLCAPAGGIVAGTKAFVAEARRAKKALGGAMRQAGVLAAPGILALTEMIERLKEDHLNAQFLGEELKTIPGIKLELPIAQQTNMVIASLEGPLAHITAADLVALWGVDGVVVSLWNPHLMRFVVHRDVPRLVLTEAVRRMRLVVEKEVARANKPNSCL